MNWTNILTVYARVSYTTERAKNGDYILPMSHGEICLDAGLTGASMEKKGRNTKYRVVHKKN